MKETNKGVISNLKVIGNNNSIAKSKSKNVLEKKKNRKTRGECPNRSPSVKTFSHKQLS